MAETKDKVIDQMWQVLKKHKKEYEWSGVIVDLLDIPELAIVDREADLGKELIGLFEFINLVKLACDFYYITVEEAGLHFAEIAGDMLEAGWVKEVKQ